MPNSLVTKAKINGDKDIVLTVKVDAISEGYVEVSGYATQNSYATTSTAGFATFSEIKEIPNTGGPAELEVTAKPTNAFQEGLDVTVAVRVSKVWVTVLSAVTPHWTDPASTVPAESDTTWESVTEVGGPDKYSLDQANAGSPATDGSSAPTTA